MKVGGVKKGEHPFPPFRRGLVKHVTAGDADAAVGVGVDGEEDGVELAGALGGLVPPVQPPQRQQVIAMLKAQGVGRGGNFRRLLVKIY